MIRVSTLKIRSREKDHAALHVAVELCRQLYNAALSERQDAYRKTGKSPSFYDQCKSLTAIRGDDPRYAAFDCDMTRMTVLQRVDHAMKAFFRRVKAGETPGYPRFRGKGRFDTLVFGGASGWKLTCGKLRLNGIGILRVTGKVHREGTPVGLRLKRKGSRWYADVLIDIGAAPAVHPSTHGVGIDVGLRTFAAMSDGTRVQHPRFLRDRIHSCPACGLVLDRDENAARNIHDLGWRLAGGDNLAAQAVRLSKPAENSA